MQACTIGKVDLLFCIVSVCQAHVVSINLMVKDSRPLKAVTANKEYNSLTKIQNALEQVKKVCSH